MKVIYDKEADAAYIHISSKTPNGGVEICRGIILHTSQTDRIVAIEILEATKKFPLNLIKGIRSFLKELFKK